MYINVYLVCANSKWHDIDEILCYVCAIAFLVCIVSVLCGMSCFILMCRKGPARAGRKGEDGEGKGSSLIVGRDRRELVGGERRCKCILFIVGRDRQEPVGGGRRCCESGSFYNLSLIHI